MKKYQTHRGFDIMDFLDANKESCSLQKSSIATDDLIWLGIDNANPKIMCSDARRLGLRELKGTEEDNGWCEFKVPKEVLMTTRMHLTREQVRNLLPYLFSFYLDGTLKKSRKIILPKIE